jgi:hypothetical protein
MMLNHMTRKYSLCVLICFALHSFAFAGAKADTAAPSSEKLVLASTTWVAALAEAAGANNVRVLAPAELRHPPEYELKPSDMALVSKADYILYAGWERFAEKLTETAGSAGVRLVKVRTENDPAVLIAEAEKLAVLFGTSGRFESWRGEFEKLTGELKAKILAAWPEKRAVVHRMQSPFVLWLGLDIAGEYGPAEPSPALILALSRLKPALVIDNYHGPSGRPIAEAAKSPYAELINFPGKDGTKTLEDVFRYNADILINAARQ